MKRFKTLQATTLAIALLASSTARATGYFDGPCDLRIRPNVVSREEGKVAFHLQGRFDSTQRKWWVDIIMVPITATFIGAWFTIPFWWTDGNASWDVRHLDPDTPEQHEKAFRDLETLCRQFIRKTFPKDILYDNGPDLIARNYVCGKPGIEGTYDGMPRENDGDGNQYYIEVLLAPAILEKLSTEVITERKCDALQICYQSSKGEDLEWITNKMGILGCL